MGSIWSWLRAQDPDLLFAYSTAKIVTIRDRRLGLLRLFLQILIVIYVLGFVILKQKQYLEYESPIGTIQTSLRKPAGTVDPATFPFCTQFGPRPADVVDQNKCTVWDEGQVLFPIDTGSSMTITTRATLTEQISNCTALGPCNAPFVESAPSTKYFMAGVETFTIGLLHTFVAPRFLADSMSTDSKGNPIAGTGDSRYSGTSAALSGTINDQNGKVLQSFEAGGNGINIFTVDTLLKAAQVSLNDASDIPLAANKPAESVRNAGVVIIAQVTYSIAGDGKKTFVITAAKIARSEYKVTTIEGAVDPKKRTQVGRHGIKIVFVQSGSISRFVFQFMIVQIFTGLGMLAIASVVVDTLMVMVMPERLYYAQAKFEKTPDFSDIRAGNAAAAQDYPQPAQEPAPNV